nr:MAG TPA: hypothetical protein [Caudoviricetes sp.]
MGAFNKGMCYTDFGFGSIAYSFIGFMGYIYQIPFLIAVRGGF